VLKKYGIMVVLLGKLQYYYPFLYRFNPFDLTITAGIYLAIVVEIAMIVIAITIAMAIAIVIAIAIAIIIAIVMDLSPYVCASGLETSVGLAR
jgi:hypothetical protein